MELLVFFIDFILPTTLWLWGWLNLWPIWVPGVYAGGKSGRCVGSTALLRCMYPLFQIQGALTTWSPEGLSRTV